MANMHDCLQVAMDAGDLDRSHGVEAQTQYAKLLDRYRTIMPEAEAEVLAAQDLRTMIKKGKASRNHAVLHQLQTMRRLDDLIGNAPHPDRALKNLVEYSENSGFRGESIKSLSDGYIRSINGALAQTLAATGRNPVGMSRNKALMTNVLQELKGETTGNPVAAKLAAEVRGQQDRMRNLFNAHGGDMGEIEGYGVKHTHDAAKLRQAAGSGASLTDSRAAWIEAVEGGLDWHRMTDKRTGKPFAAHPGDGPDDALRAHEFLSEVFDNITTGGWHKREPAFQRGGKALFNQRAEARQLHFRSADDWMSYNEKFGQGDPFTSMLGGVHGLARDVAQMRVLGPNPRAGLEYATQVATKRAMALERDPKMAGRVDRAGRRAAQMLSHFDGSANVAHHEFWGAFFGGARQTIVAAKLGSAILSSATDLVTLRAAAAHVGMNPNAVNVRAMKLMGSGAARADLRRMGYVADTLASVGSMHSRFTGETFAPELTQRLSEFTMRASGLSFWTDMIRLAFQTEFAGFLASMADRSFGDLDRPLRRLFEARGISPADWDKLRDARHLFKTDGGETFLAPSAWREATDLNRAEAEGLSMRLQMIIEEQMERAVPTANLEFQSLLVGENAPGSFVGELTRSGVMFKSFAMSLTMNQIRRFMAIDTGKGRAVYAAKMMVGLTIMGGVSVQLKELAKGRDPRPMDDTKFWAAATFQGGGLGIFGDFFASETNRFGGGIASSLAGPMVGLGSDVVGLGGSAFSAAVEGRDQTIGRDLTTFVRYNTPVASSLWYQRLAFDRLVADQMQQFLDADAYENWKRQERNRTRSYGNETWWGRGKTAPSRGPNFSTALGDER